MKYLKKMTKIEDKQFATDLINHNKKQIEFFEGNNHNTPKAVPASNLNITYQKQKKTKKKKI